MASYVGIERVKNIEDRGEVKNKLFTLLDSLNNISPLNIASNSTVAIKPNICYVKGYETGATVDPYIVKCLVDWLNENYTLSKILICESDATELNLNVAYKALGWEEMFSDYKNVKLINMSKDTLVEVDIDGLYFRKIKMSKKYINADYLISVAKLKTHTLTKITGILKNQYGAIPEKRKVKYHKHLDCVICDVVKVKPPNLCIVDGIIAMEREGPVSGLPKPIGLLIVGNDPVAVDHACARIMGFNPSRISHLKLAAKNGLGSFEYEVFGLPIESVKVKFEFVPLWKHTLTKLYRSKFMKIFLKVAAKVVT